MEGLWLVGGCALALFISCFLYSWGGYSNKWLRRYVAPLILVLATNVAGVINQNWHWQYLLMYPILVGAFSLGYGSEIQWQKVLKRLIVAICCLLASLCGLWGVGWMLSGFGVLTVQVLLSLFSIYFGVKNPFSNARLEEFLVCLFLTLFIPFWSFIR